MSTLQELVAVRRELERRITRLGKDKRPPAQAFVSALQQALDQLAIIEPAAQDEEKLERALFANVNREEDEGAMNPGSQIQKRKDWDPYGA